MNNNATEWKCRWLGKIQCTGILNENVTKKKWKWPGKMQGAGILRKKKKKKITRKDATYRDLVKIFKSWQVCDWLAKWIIMLRFMNLRWPRVFRRSNVCLVIAWYWLYKIKIRLLTSKISSTCAIPVLWNYNECSRIAQYAQLSIFCISHANNTHLNVLTIFTSIVYKCIKR